MKLLQNKRVLLGVTGGIAAYKSADLVRRLRDQGAEVQVVMTVAAQRFVTPLTFQAVSGNPVHTSLLDREAEAGMGHIELARWADIILIAPASANFLARLCQGLADDLLTTICLASEAQLAVAPAMNQQMWQAASTQQNCQQLRQRGVVQLGPGVGDQACGEVGAGRMLEPLEIVASLADGLKTGELAGVKVMITAGPTREALDPVRYISNHSSGKMGFAVAQAAVEAGAQVTLISGPVNLTTPRGVDRHDIISADELLEKVMEQLKDCQIFIATAAVVDYKPSQIAAQKIKKSTPELRLDLEKTSDVLATVAALSPAPFTVGFAAETEKLETYARGKMAAKKLDMIAANRVDDPKLGFHSDENALDVFWADGTAQLPQNSKLRLGQELIELIAKQFKLSSKQKS